MLEGLRLCYATLQNLIPSFPRIGPPASNPVQSKERKGSNFAAQRSGAIVLRGQRAKHILSIIWLSPSGNHTGDQQRPPEGDVGLRLAVVFDQVVEGTHDEKVDGGADAGDAEL